MGNYFSFNGRIGRQTYWLAYLLPAFAVLCVAGLIDVANGHGSEGVGPTGLVASLVCLVPSLAGGAKRCHDRGKSGWWLLVGLVPILGLLWSLIELGCLRGTWGANEYGGDPLSTRWSAIA